MVKYNKDEFIEVCKSSPTMAQAASKLGMHFNTFRRIAKKLNCYKTNQSGKGLTKKSDRGIPLSDMLDLN